MILPSFAAFSALSLAVSAFVVPDIIDDTSLVPSGLSLHPVEVHNALRNQVDLFCSECPYPDQSNDDRERTWSNGVRSSLSLNFVMREGVLTVNDSPIFPPPISLNISAVQRRLSDGDESLVSLGFAVEILSQSPIQDSEGEMWLVRFTVLDLDGQPVAMDSVALQLVKIDVQELLIARMEVEPTATDRLSWKHCRNRINCLRQLIAARVQALIASAKARLMGAGARLASPTGCRGRRPPPVANESSAPEPTDGESFPPHRHHPVKGHHRHHHHRHRTGWQRTFSRVVRFIVVPAILGVSAGLVASAVGMLVGQVVVFLWLRYRRSLSAHSARPVRSAMMPGGSDMEKEALLAESSDADLPPYSDVACETVNLPVDRK